MTTTTSYITIKRWLVGFAVLRQFEDGREEIEGLYGDYTKARQYAEYLTEAYGLWPTSWEEIYPARCYSFPAVR